MKYQRRFFVLFFFVLLPGLLSAQKQQTITKRLTPLKVSQLQSVDEIALAPSGKQVAYTVTNPADPRKKNKLTEHHLYVRNLSSRKSHPYVTTMGVSNIAFRPGKQAVTFLAKRKNDQAVSLYQIALAGGEAQRIFSFPTAIADYSWAPDGNHLAFMAADTTQIPDSPLPYEPEIYEENLKQRRGFVTNLARPAHQPQQLQVEGSIYQMHWSPNGKRLAIAVAPTPLVDDYYMHQQVLIVDHYGQVFGKVKHRGKLGHIAWSPDGSRLAMLAGADIHDPTAGRLFVVPASGGTPTQLQPHFKGKFEQFQWGDSNTLYYLTSVGVWSTFGRINADGTHMETIVDKGGPYLSHFDRTSDSTVVFIADHASHPPELYQLDPTQNKVVRLTNSNEWLKDIALGQQKAVSWVARDGTELQGLLIYPINYQKGNKYPLITVVHGGPESHYDNGWLTSYAAPGQVAAGQGYFVFYPNYRGSTGRGEQFAKSSQGDLAGAEFDDIVAGVDELVRGGLADSSRVGVTGGSYGGYATGWLSTRYTDRFAAGVMFVGVSDNISKWGTSDIPEELYLVHTRKRIWEDYEFFLKRSPIYYAGQAQTPLLILAGKQDTRVDPSQSYEMYRHIKTRTDTPVRLVLYPGEGHGNDRATARYDYNLRMMRWFNEYLKEANPEKPAPRLKDKRIPDVG